MQPDTRRRRLPSLRPVRTETRQRRRQWWTTSTTMKVKNSALAAMTSA
jgi:hypothetical protein